MTNNKPSELKINKPNLWCYKHDQQGGTKGCFKCFVESKNKLIHAREVTPHDIECSQCKGTGILGIRQKDCKNCDGTGLISTQPDLEKENERLINELILKWDGLGKHKDDDFGEVEEVIERIKALKAQLLHYETDALHTCHDGCTRKICVLGRENERLKEELSEAMDCIKKMASNDFEHEHFDEDKFGYVTYVGKMIHAEAFLEKDSK